MKSLTELLTPRTAEQWKDTIFSKLAGRGFPVTDWHVGSEERTNVEADAYALEVASMQVPTVAGSGFLDTASGDWLDWVAFSQYNESRKGAVQGRVWATLTALPGRGPYELRPGDIWAATPEGFRFNSITGGTIPLGGSLRVLMAAEGFGAVYNILPGALTVLQTPYPGVTITNAEGMETVGVDAESDAGLRERCRLKWASIGYGGSRDAYRFHALSARPAVTKVKVLDEHPRGQGSVDVILWGAGGVSAEDVAAVDAVLQVRRSNTANVLTYAATPVILAVTGTATVRQAQLATAPAVALANLKALEAAVDIGGVVYDGQVQRALMAGPGMVDISLTGPLGDLQLAPNQVAVFDLRLVWQGV